MKGRWTALGSLALTLALTLTLTACAGAADPSQSGSAADHALGLTAEQRMEDYAYFWTALRDSYPCWGIWERAGLDTDAICREYQDLLSQSDSDADFYTAVYSTLWRLGGDGHLWVVEPEDYWDLAGAAADPRREHWRAVETGGDTAEKYRRLETLLRLMGGDGGEASDSNSGEPAPNVTGLLLPGGDVGYLKINSFGGDMAADKAVVDDAYARFAGCGDLILDLTENSGGSDDYWKNLLVAPNIEKPLKNTNLALVRMSGNNRPYLENEFSDEELHPVSALPALPKLAAEDLALATHYVEVEHTVEPGTRGPFHGRIWVLVSEAVYSASESFAIFCKDTGFATLVGTATGGDGIGIDPIYMQLPNSGILIRFTALFGLNADGASNEEFGTAPDISSPEGESPLVTALRAIGRS